ncbi:hypothetical protein HXX76_015306 [Chlamydomonas incerta]|uniref:Arrestin C-terminal-like domain-containing protein n=1 Tax=Chlamydomonas incerta TaxID=51695 RepID=A0A835SMK6_CHLIN|nr:hypothetical protein HXX76_015306 [Chlamydomonas incerta]|eukprot:KAG2423435.1 hypothetical protein HXX76_015306 [Chlamydomonas incerta]
MPNSSTRNALFLQTAAPVYGASDVVEGQAVLSLAESLEVESVDLTVYGHEGVGWEEAHAKEPKLQDQFSPSQLATPVDSQQQQQQPAPSVASKASQLGVARHGQRKIFNVCVPLLSGGPRVLQPGTYALPFRMQLPADMPGTFRFSSAPARTIGGVSYRGLSGEVSYGMQAEVRQSAAAAGAQPVLRASCDLMITQRPAAAGAAAGARGAQGPPSQQEHATAAAAPGAAEEAAALPCDEMVTLVPAFFFCCTSNGRLTVRLRPGRDAYVAGEAAEVVVEVDNRSTQEFRDVRLEVERHLTLLSSAGGGGSAGSSGTGSSIATAAAAAGAGAGVGDGGDAGAGLAPGCFCEEERIFKSKSTASILPGACYLGANALRLPVPLPSNTPPSTSGALVRCAYFATVEVLPVSATALRGATPPRVRVPLTLFAPAASGGATRQQQAQQPDAGRPAHVVLAPPVEIVLPAAAPQPPPAAQVTIKQQHGAHGGNPVYAGP